jgi:ABC-type multidrug transport system fused ATPase/permease subunit
MVIGYSVPSFLWGVPPVLCVYYYVAKRYLTTSRELKRIESVTRSPIYAQFSESLSGVATIRAYNAEARFSKLNMEKVDVNHQSFFFIWAANRWLCLRTDILSGLVVMGSGILVILSDIDAGWAALTITYALEFTNVLLWTVRMVIML